MARQWPVLDGVIVAVNVTDVPYPGEVEEREIRAVVVVSR